MSFVCLSLDWIFFARLCSITLFGFFGLLGCFPSPHSMFIWSAFSVYVYHLGGLVTSVQSFRPLLTIFFARPWCLEMYLTCLRRLQNSAGLIFHRWVFLLVVIPATYIGGPIELLFLFYYTGSNLWSCFCSYLAKDKQ